MIAISADVFWSNPPSLDFKQLIEGDIPPGLQAAADQLEAEWSALSFVERAHHRRQGWLHHTADVLVAATLFFMIFGIGAVAADITSGANQSWTGYVVWLSAMTALLHMLTRLTASRSAARHECTNPYQWAQERAQTLGS